jgi:restriction endonuclease S subunit
MSQGTEIDTLGVNWMGLIPNTWAKVAVKRYYNIQLGKMLQNTPISENDIFVPYLKALNVLWGQVKTDDLPRMWASPLEIEQYGVKDGDLLVCEGGEGGRAGILKSPPHQCIIQNALHRVRQSPSANVEYLQYVLEAVNSSGWFSVLCNKATISHFTREKFANLNIPIPSIKQQSIIVRYLNNKTQRIDNLITKKQQQIELLQEKRFVLISHVVTKGLNPNVKMKDSGVEWLGEIPEHWEQNKLKYCSDIVNEKHNEIPLGLSYLYLENIESKTGMLVNDSSIVTSEGQVSLLQTGDVLFCKLRPYLAKVFRANNKGACTGELFVLRPKLVTQDFLFYFLVSPNFIDVVNSSTYGTKMPRANWDTIGNLPFLVPPYSEQKSITKYLNIEIEKNCALVSNIKNSISTLQEYRTALISAAVTGKIDVRQEFN